MTKTSKKAKKKRQTDGGRCHLWIQGISSDSWISLIYYYQREDETA